MAYNLHFYIQARSTGGQNEWLLVLFALAGLCVFVSFIILIIPLCSLAALALALFTSCIFRLCVWVCMFGCRCRPAGFVSFDRRFFAQQFPLYVTTWHMHVGNTFAQQHSSIYELKMAKCLSSQRATQCVDNAYFTIPYDMSAAESRLERICAEHM